MTPSPSFGEACNELAVSLGAGVDLPPALSGLLSNVGAELAQIGDRNTLEETIEAVSLLLRLPEKRSRGDVGAPR